MAMKSERWRICEAIKDIQRESFRGCMILINVGHDGNVNSVDVTKDGKAVREYSREPHAPLVPQDGKC
jgi:hypothetical protein